MGELKMEAQRRLKRRFVRLAFQGQVLDPGSTVRDVGAQDGDGMNAIVQPVCFYR